jgi:hypothetical protein
MYLYFTYCISPGNDVREPSHADITIISFPQYCRYRGVMKRLETMTDKWLKNALVSAIGGLTARSRNNRIMFCRDIFDNADLDDLELRCDHLGT